MSGQHDNRENGNRYGVPIEQPDISTHVEICEKCHREISLRVKGNTARNIASGRAEQNSEKKIGKHENEIPIGLPKAIVNVSANFDRDAAQNQAPEDQKQRQIITG